MTSSLWLEKLSRTGRHRAKLFCFPYAGGGPSAFRSWSSWLPDLEIVGIQLPGHEKRFKERPLDWMPAIVEQLLEPVDLEIDGPFLFFGHSMGALIAFELARALRRLRQMEPECLFVSGSAAPQLVEFEEAGGSDRDDLESRLRDLGGTAQEILSSPSLLNMFAPMLRADFAVVDHYVYEPGDGRLSCPVVALYGKDDRVSPKKLVTGWADETAGAFCMHGLDGAHLGIMTDPGIYIESVRSHVESARPCGLEAGI